MAEESISGGSRQPIATATGRETRYAWYVTLVLMLCYTVAFMDAKLPFILIESIKADLALSDTQIGIITGPAFSLTYALTVVPIARLADRYSRRYVIATAITVWSAFTAAGGFAHSFITLMLSRTGVAIGEGGLTPAAHSIISDIFPQTARAKAIAVYSCGISLGAFLALFAGGVINDRYGWRTAMFLVGATGLVLTALIVFTVAEPKRVTSSATKTSVAGRETVRSLFADPVVRHTIIGGMFLCVANGASAWLPAYIIRTFSMTTSQVGATFGIAAGGLALIGTLFGGLFSSWISRHDPRRGFWFIALAFAFSAVMYVLALVMQEYVFFLFFASFATLLLMFYPGPTYAMIQSRVGAGSRSFASAVTLFCLSGVGVAFGTFITGWLSDLLFTGDDAESLRWALGIVYLASAWGAFHYVLATRHLPART